MLPNYLVIGAPKCATTSLCYHLGRHPEVFMSNPKETFFFSYDDVYAKGIDWYRNHFEEARGMKAVGEGTTVYSQTETFPNTLSRITKYVPDASIIYLVRHPLERIQSHWVEMHSQGLTMQPFNTAIVEDPQYLDASMYLKQLNAYKEHFPDEKILVLFYEDYKVDTGSVLARCFEFLGVDASIKLDGVDKPRYVSEGKRRDIKLTNFLRRNMPGFYWFRDNSPKFLREFAKNISKKEIVGKPEWDQDVKAQIISELEKDTRDFLLSQSRSSDYWELV